jgi:hypothetical protein
VTTCTPAHADPTAIAIRAPADTAQRRKRIKVRENMARLA